MPLSSTRIFMTALTSLLVRDGVVPVRKIEEALQRQVLSGGDVETVLLEMDAVSENVLIAYRALLFELAPATRQHVMSVSPAVLRLVPKDVALEHRLIPLARSGRILEVAVREPLDAERLERLSFLLGYEIAPRITLELRVAAGLAHHYGADLTPRFARLIERLRTHPSGTLPALRANRIGPPAEIPEKAFEGNTRPIEPLKNESAKRDTDPEMGPVPLEPSAVVPLAAVRVDDGSRWEEKRIVRRAERVIPRQPVSGGGLRRLRGPMTLAAGERMLKRASNRDQIMEVFFSFAQQFFDYTALFVVHEQVADGREAWGLGASTEEVKAITIPLDQTSVFAEARRSLAPLVRRLEATQTDRDVAAALRRANTPVAMVMPIAIRQRVVLLLYGDRDGEAFDLGAVMELVRFSSRVIESFEQLILRKKRAGYHEGEPEPTSLKQTARTIATTAGRARPSVDQRRHDQRAWRSSKRGPHDTIPDMAIPAMEEPRTTQPFPPPAATEESAPVPVAREESAPAPRRPVTQPMGIVQPIAVGGSAEPERRRRITQPFPIAPDATPKAILRVPRDAPPPPSAEFHFAQEEEEEETATDDEPELTQDEEPELTQDEEPELTQDDEPELSTDEDEDAEPEVSFDAETDDFDDLVEDEAPAASQPPTKSRLEGTYRVRGGPIDVVRPSDAPRRKRARARRDAQQEDDEEGEFEDDRSVIIDMGEQVHAQVEDLLAAHGPEQQSALIQGLLYLGEAALPALVQAFPGPLRYDRTRETDGAAPRGRDVSTIARVLVLFGPRAVPYVAALLSSAHADVRYYASLVASELIHPGLMTAVAERIFDEDPGVRRLACALLPRFAGFRGFDEVRELMRRAARVRTSNAARRWQAVDVLTTLRDVESVPLFVELLKEGDPDLVEHVRRALVVLTCTDRGPSYGRWRTWLSRNGKRHRIEWLIEGLLNGDETVRSIAGTELELLTQEHFGFHAGSPKRERERVHRRYRRWWREEGQRRFV